MMCKTEGDGLQTYDIFHKRYTYQIFMYNDTVSKIYLVKRLLPLYSRAMTLFDTVEERYRKCTMDNLYNSTTFFKTAYNQGKKY